LKKILLLMVISFSLLAQAFSEVEWTEFIGETIVTKEDMTWTYDVKKLKLHQDRIKKEDLVILEKIAKSEDVQMSQGAKYLLATQGEKTNTFLLNNYLNEENIKNGLYYLNLNFINTVEKNHLWDLINYKESFSRSSLKNEFSQCKEFKDYHAQGGKDFTFDNYDDFFEQRGIVENYTNADLFSLELELSDIIYPVTITFYNNRYIIQSANDDICIKVAENKSYIEMQKIMALYKQYKKIEYLKKACDEFSSNSLLNARFNYFCIDLK